jgi:hypothetical protein
MLYKMKTVKTTVLASATALMAFSSISCKEAKKNEPATPMSNQMHQQDVNAEGDLVNENEQKSKATAILTEYLSIKDALVEDSAEEAADAGSKLVSALEAFDVSSYSDAEQTELKDIILDAKEHAEHISESPMEHQREHFDVLSKDVIDLVGITGTDKTLYQDFCPMYNNNKGAQWLSATKEIKNPYYGAKMMSCGSVQKEIN